MTVFHFSEDPSIARFEPRVPEHRRGEVDPLVWAIDEWHQPMYLFPRDCPRILLWPLHTTTAEDRSRWFGDSEARMLAHVERGRLDRIRAARVHRYTFADEGFEDLRDVGMWVSRAAVVPEVVEPVGDLLAALRAANVELRVLERLTPLRDAWDSTLHASGIRLRNAIDWDEPPAARCSVGG